MRQAKVNVHLLHVSEGFAFPFIIESLYFFTHLGAYSTIDNMFKLGKTHIFHVKSERLFQTALTWRFH